MNEIVNLLIETAKNIRKPNSNKSNELQKLKDNLDHVMQSDAYPTDEDKQNAINDLKKKIDSYSENPTKVNPLYTYQYVGPVFNNNDREDMYIYEKDKIIRALRIYNKSNDTVVNALRRAICKKFGRAFGETYIDPSRIEIIPNRWDK